MARKYGKASGEKVKKAVREMKRGKLAFPLQLHVHASAGRREFHGVTRQLPHDLLHPIRIGANDPDPGTGRIDELHLFARADRANSFDSRCRIGVAAQRLACCFPVRPHSRPFRCESPVVAAQDSPEGCDLQSPP